MMSFRSGSSETSTGAKSRHAQLAIVAFDAAKRMGPDTTLFADGIFEEHHIQRKHPLSVETAYSHHFVNVRHSACTG